MTVWDAARELLDGLVVDEGRDVVRWLGPDCSLREAGLHDYAALYAVPGLYDAVYFLHLEGRAPHLLAQALASAVPEQERATRRVLDVGAGTGAVGAALLALGFRPVVGTDLEPASALAVRRDRPEAYREARTADLTAPTPDDLAWLQGVAPDVVTVAGAVGYGHLPVAALAQVTRLLPVGGLLALTVAPGLDTDRELAAHAALLLGPAYEVVVRREGVHRQSDRGPLAVVALVLRKEEDR
jgi:SAM-dependent methyltransferase